MADRPAGAAPSRDEAVATRYRAYERVFKVLSESAEQEGAPSHELSYRQHVAIETLRDIELTRRRYLLLHPAGRDGAARIPDGAASDAEAGSSDP